MKSDDRGEGAGEEVRDPESGSTEPKKRRTPLWKKLLLALAAPLVFLGIIELIASSYLDAQTPKQLRDGIYVDNLPLATGLIAPMLEARPKGDKPTLDADKPEGQIRIFVFGESSVHGSPYGAVVSAPTMLYDQLAAAMPGRDIVVVNMGKPGSIMPNTWYHLMSIRDLQPDYIIFHHGINDGLQFGGEECLALEHPTGYGIWRTLARNLDMLFLLRVYAPSLVGANASGGKDVNCELRPFPFWADLLVEEATAMGAKVIVSTPIRNDAYAFDVGRFGKKREHPLDGASESYLTLISCQLDPGCDYPRRFAEVLDAPENGDERRRIAELHTELDGLRDAWKAAAEKHGAVLVDFREALRRASPAGRLLAAFFTDEVHLTAAGNYFLAQNWLAALAPMMGFELPGPPSPPTDDALKRYEGTLAEDHGIDLLRPYLAGNFVLSTVPGIQDMAAHCWRKSCTSRKDAEALLRWLGWRSGYLKDLSAEEVGELEQLESTLHK